MSDDISIFSTPSMSTSFASTPISTNTTSASITTNASASTSTLAFAIVNSTRSTSISSTSRTTSEIYSSGTSGSYTSWNDWNASPPSANHNAQTGHSSSSDVAGSSTNVGDDDQDQNFGDSGVTEGSSGPGSSNHGDQGVGSGSATFSPDVNDQGLDSNVDKPPSSASGSGAWHGTPSDGWSNSTATYNNTGRTNTTDDNEAWIGENDGIPALTAADIAFITDNQTFINAGFYENEGLQNGTRKKREFDFFGGANTKEKWDEMDMDEWLVKYIKRIPIAGKSTKLIDSTNFFTEFWLSTGDEATVLCNTLYNSCQVAETSKKKRFSYISENDGLRAQFVRQVMGVWQSGNKQAFEIISNAVSNSQNTITTAHKLFLQDDPPPTTNILDIVLPALAAVAAFVPTLAPAIAVLNSVYAAAKDIGKREESDMRSVMSHDVTKATASSHDKRASEGLYDDIYSRVAALEKQPTKTWVENLNKQVDNSAKSIDKASKAVVALLALNPKVSTAKITSWDSFDSRVFNDLVSFPESILVAFEENQLDWLATETTLDAGGPVIGVGGMKNVLLGGEWSKV
ncbi:hypothetical protein LTR10_018914 [Elasticomyces elasticus]|uniref:Uncharacterized protein n=1 Tax=Exophiala sideris TaxID=1016849 RepID=A0ABR0JKQ0_9EURO|nr:hypothetical protein LTR10_018914 [Elasticomyces elasticus]KAK5034441.1 hypothetical protein LTS07_003362 [Exophiala sideris]KAK5042738.1 hypothetical protein LTR13_001586 [Exophiala sideris]KAK5065821.1 hypothetical protein LTR69_003371 [Exophiala sideris]KAK5185718.1 hypothetical protein LTR44_001767 [Eurotiomycetes sp. CCFEE 6388]